MRPVTDRTKERLRFFLFALLMTSPMLAAILRALK
jgi:hypothetical protein